MKGLTRAQLGLDTLLASALSGHESGIFDLKRGEGVGGIYIPFKSFGGIFHDIHMDQSMLVTIVFSKSQYAYLCYMIFE